MYYYFHPPSSSLFTNEQQEEEEATAHFIHQQFDISIIYDTELDLLFDQHQQPRNSNRNHRHTDNDVVLPEPFHSHCGSLDTPGYDAPDQQQQQQQSPYRPGLLTVHAILHRTGMLY